MSTKAPVTRWAAFNFAAGLAATAVLGEAAPDYFQPGAAPEQPPQETMKPFVVAEGTYKAFLSPNEIQLLNLFKMLSFDYDYGPSITRFAGSFVATPLRIPQHPKNSAFTAYAESGKALREIPATAVDEALASEPEFAPTGGAMLRGIRAKLLLDGVPFDNPFGGSALRPDAPWVGLARAEEVPGGGSTAWGNGALGGVVQLFTVPPSGELVTKPGSLFGGGPPDPTLTKQVVEGTGEVEAMFGEFDTRSVEFAAAQPTVAGVLQLMGGAFASDGSPVVSGAQRGPVDISAWSRNDWLEARWRQLVGKKLVLTVTVRGTEGSRGNGTAYQQDDSIGRFGSVSLSGHPSSNFAWNAVGYAQDGDASGTFSFVNAARTAETPVLDKVGEPTTAYGASWSGEWWQADGSSTSAGIDYHHVSGETREEYAFAGGVFGQELTAGGAQDGLGAYLLRDQSLTSTLRAVAGIRLDGWRDSEGHQDASDLTAGGMTRAEQIPDDSGTEFSPSLGLVWRPDANLRLHVNGQQAFSTPTLGDLYQPSAEGSIVTESNPLLRTEHNTSFEAGMEYTIPLKAVQSPHPSRSASPGTLTLGATAFSNDLHDAVGLLAFDGNSVALPIFGSLPSGYLGEQRISVNHSRIEGVTLSARWDPVASFSLDASVVLSDPTIGSVAAAPFLDGRQIGGVPRRSAVVSSTWHPLNRVTLTARVRILGPQFVDDEDTLRLAEAVVVDLRASYALTRHSELFATAKNLTNARIETGRSTTGLVYVGSPGTLLGGIRFSW